MRAGACPCPRGRYQWRMTDEKPNDHRDIAALLEVMRRLRDPKTGCPWDIEQSFATIVPYTIEEAYEVAGAIEERDWAALKEELGDLLLQVVFHARLAEEKNLFDFSDVVDAIVTKMVRRHPHVFAGLQGIDSADTQTAVWETYKSAERASKAAEGPKSLLDDVPAALPALLRAMKLQKRAGTVGFDWESAPKVVEKIAEEAQEVVEALTEGAPLEKLEDEVGDLLFAVANLARHLKVDPETALRATNRKFVQRFKFIEQTLAAEGRTPAEASLDEMEAIWQRAKGVEKRQD